MTTKARYKTREEWLTAAADVLRHDFAKTFESFPHYADMGTVRVATGFPFNERGGRVLGQCFPSTATKDKSHHIIITPRTEDPIKVLSTLLHELIHAADNGKNQHKGAFTRAIREVGLAGKPTATYVEPGTELATYLEGVADRLGAYPHAALNPMKLADKQTTRMLKVECQRAKTCGCVVRMTRKWLDEVGPPRCGCGGTMKEVEV